MKPVTFTTKEIKRDGQGRFYFIHPTTKEIKFLQAWQTAGIEIKPSTSLKP